MCRIMEDVRNEGAQGRSIETAKEMLNDGTLPIEKIAKFSKLSVDEVKKLRDNRMA